ncbi:hypothetical protein QBC42DRAFT_275022 [Cladorrhinum samala]|uniref:Uncharacterized protein n=1 Tax=Cladorrhinum samala TaxID=585594 RepID=A0AAV9HJF3_9PEZI|nr:hypothetical protein QBC42DRAFT_275022 [Cladorrhinum samala]
MPIDPLQQTANSRFLACNDDVVRLIIGSDISKNDHVALCLAHSHLRRLAEPFLYSRITLGPWRNPRYYARPHSISLLLRAILRRPDLAACIRAIELDSGWYQSGFNNPGARAYHFIVHEPDLEIIVPCVERTWAQMPCRDAWISELRQGVMDAYVALLIVSAPGLLHLQLNRDFFFDSARIGAVMRFAILNSAPVLQHVRTVRLQRWIRRLSDWPAQNTTNVLPFFYLPQVEEMRVWLDDPRDQDISWPTGSSPSLPHLVSLKLYEIREQHLGRILSVSPNLRSLYWEWGFQPDDEHEFDSGRLDLDLLRSALERVEGTLTKLDLAAEVGMAYHSDLRLEHRMRILGSPPTWLADFHRLKKLTIPLAFLTGLIITDPTEAGARLNKSLPRNLEELSFSTQMLYNEIIRWDEYDIGYIPAIRSWMETASTTLPRLQKLRVESDDGQCNECAHEYCRMKREMLELAEKAGIQFEFVDVIEDETEAQEKLERSERLKNMPKYF